MANYAVDDFTYGPATNAECAEWLETKIELYDAATKTIRYAAINSVHRDRDLCIATLIIDT